MRKSWLGRVVRTFAFRSGVYRDLAGDSFATRQSTLTTLLAALLADNFFLYTIGESSNVFLRFGVPLLWGGGLVIWAGLLFAQLFDAGPRPAKYIEHLRAHGFSTLGLAIPILVLSLIIRSTNHSRIADILWVPTGLLGFVWMFAMQIHALRELVEVSVARAIGAVLLGLAVVFLVGVVLFYNLHTVS